MHLLFNHRIHLRNKENREFNYRLLTFNCEFLTYVPWEMARKEFDKLESTQKGTRSVEGISSQNAQRVGWNIGHSKAPAGLIPRLWRSREAIKKYLKGNN